MWKVRAADDEFIIVEKFDTFEKALEYADKMCDIFGSWNVDVYKV